MQTAFISALSNAVYYIAIVYNIDRNLVIYLSISTELKSLNIMIIIYYNGGTKPFDREHIDRELK